MVWARRDHILPRLAKGLERGGGADKITAEMLLMKALVGDALVWVSDDMAGCALVRQYPTGAKALSVVSVGGKDMNTWLADFIAKLRAAAANLGCAEVDFSGRFGWDRVLAKHGWKRASLHMTLEV